MKESKFNLLYEPWIRVMDPHGHITEVSIFEVLLNAQNYKKLAGETETQNAPVLRILEAIMMTAVYRYDENGNDALLEDENEAFERWSKIWKAGHVPEKMIKKYLELYKNRFWLIDEKYPFMQSPRAKIGTDYKTSKLIGELSESNNKTRLFQGRAGVGKEYLSAGEATRWLLFVNAYDDTSAKAKQKGLPSPGAGWLGQIGQIYAAGDNLFQTLMLNLVLSNNGELWDDPTPSWEQELREGERTEIAPPSNPAALYTIASRRLLLKWQGDQVVGYTSLGGDFFNKDNFFVETNTAYRIDKKSKSASVYLPKKTDPSKQMWRNFRNLFVETEVEENRLPGVVKWIHALQEEQILDEDQTITFETCSVQYGDKCFFINDLTGDSIQMNSSVLSDKNWYWKDMIERTVSLCEKVADSAGYCKRNLAISNGITSPDVLKKERNVGKEEMYAKLDFPIRTWLSQLDPHTQEWQDEFESFKKVIQKSAWEICAEWSSSYSMSSLEGRLFEGVHYSLPESISRFKGSIVNNLKGGN